MTLQDHIEDGTEIDGRTARRDRNHQAVIDAVIELFAEGNLVPSPDEVAKRSGVSLRSVYRYVSDADELLRQATEVHLERVRPLAVIHDIGHGELRDRIDRFVTARLGLYDAIAATARAAMVLEATNKVVRERRQMARRDLRAQFEQQFAPELDRMDPSDRKSAVATGDVLTQLEGLEFLRAHRRMSAKEAGEHLHYALTALLA